MKRARTARATTLGGTAAEAEAGAGARPEKRQPKRAAAAAAGRAGQMPEVLAAGMHLMERQDWDGAALAFEGALAATPVRCLPVLPARSRGSLFAPLRFGRRLRVPFAAHSHI